MKWISLAFLAVFFPWVSFLREGMLGYAVLALILQASVIGWIVAIGWAWRMTPGLQKPKVIAPAEPKVTTETNLKL